MSDTVGDGQYVGALRSKRVLDGLTVAETDYRPGLVIPEHAHATALIALVLDGSMTEARGSRTVRCDTGSIIYQPPEEPHAHRFHDAGGRCLIIQLGSPWTDRMRALDVLGSSSPLALRRSRANWLAAQLYREFRSPDAAAELAMEGFALAMLGELARAKEASGRSAKPPWLIRAVEILHARFREELRMAEIAAAVDIHPVHLSRTFRRLYGMTMGEYVRRLRVEHARQELLATDRPLSAIALDAGFADQAHFSRVFKEIVGDPPGVYRQRRTAP